MKSNLKKMVSIVLVAIMIAIVAIPSTRNVYAFGVTRDGAIQWVKDHKGQKIGSGQCVALVAAYIKYLGGSAPSVNYASQYSTCNVSSGFQRIAGAQPQKGDILIWTGGNQGMGHVAIYESDYSTWHQNVSGSQYVLKLDKYYTLESWDRSIKYWGVWRPDFSDAPLTPIKTPEISVDKTQAFPGDVVNISWISSNDSPNLSHYWIIINDSAGNTLVNEAVNLPSTSFSYTLSAGAAIGNYTIQVGATPRGSVSGEGTLWATKNISVVPKNREPVSYVDRVSGLEGAISVKGWSFDPDNTADSVRVHVYIGGPAEDPNAEFHGDVLANGYRPDVNNVHKCGDYHGFDNVIQTDKVGKQMVHLYALDTEHGTNPWLGAYEVNITPIKRHTNIVTFDPNGGTITGDASYTVISGVGDYNFVGWLEPTKYSSLFEGWYTEPIGGTMIYDAEGKVTNDGTYFKDNNWVGENDLTVYAHWKMEFRFTDVKLGGWQETAVRYVLENAIMSGRNETTFDPNTAMTRAQLVTVLWNIEGQPKDGGKMPFNDVWSKSVYYNAILWGSQNKIINGYATGEFKPSEPLTRQQIAAILMNYAKFKGITIKNTVDISGYKDVALVNKSMTTAMQWAVGNKIISGKSNGTMLDPKGQATRVEVAAMVMNYCKKFR